MKSSGKKKGSYYQLMIREMLKMIEILKHRLNLISNYTEMKYVVLPVKI